MDSIKNFTPLMQAGTTREIVFPKKIVEVAPEQLDQLQSVTTSDLPDMRSIAFRPGTMQETSSPHVGLLDIVPDMAFLSTLGVALTLASGGCGMAAPSEAHAQPTQAPAIERIYTPESPATGSSYRYSRPEVSLPQSTPSVNWTPDMKVIPVFDDIQLPPGMELPPLELPPGVDMPQFPTNLQGMSNDSFIEQMVRAKQEALRRAAQSGALNHPQNNQTNQSGKGSLSVNAHGYEEGGVYHPVKNIKIAEYGNYKNRTNESYTNYGYNPEQSLSLDTAKKGEWYNVTVTWEGGESRTYQVKMDSDSAQTFSAYH
jgi:hypothetical protein